MKSDKTIEELTLEFQRLINAMRLSNEELKRLIEKDIEEEE